MRKLLLIPCFFLLSGACCAGQKYPLNCPAGKAVQSKKDKDILASKEILITSLFAATSHMPEALSIDIEFCENKKTNLSKEAKNKISKFAAEVLRHEDYSITVLRHKEADEAEYSADYKKISLQKAENIRKALIKNGIDKDKIKIAVSQIKSPYEEEKGRHCEDNSRVIIEAELW